MVKSRFLHEGWVFRAADQKTFLPAQVPGVVHLDLLRNGVIPDPFLGNNEAAASWVDDTDWVYQIKVPISAQDLSHDGLYLVFDGLDTHAQVFLNDHLILSADNMFRSWRIDVRAVMRLGENLLRIHFRSADAVNRQLASRLPYALPADDRVHSRKAPYHFGWDWGPRLVGCGIWRPVRLEFIRQARIDALHLQQKQLDPKRTIVSARVTIDAMTAGPAKLRFSSPNKKFDTVEENIQLEPGTQTYGCDLQIDNPRLWWCNGLGEPHLYEIRVELLTTLGRDERRDHLGLRTVELVTDKDAHGSSFYFKLNGVMVFAKGANYVPMDSFLPRVSETQYRRVIDDAVKANFNMLRVWGGGVYEDEIFYRLCDEQGIMVWQDFMFACAMYPGDESFMANVEVELRQNVARLRNHPSIVLWCGNNEIANGWQDWGWQKDRGFSEAQKVEIYSYYRQLFHQLIPKVLSELDPHRPYWPSSPSWGWGHPESLRMGDNHYWGVWWGKEPFSIYKERISRFMSEFGFQSLPSPQSIARFIAPQDRHVDSLAMKQHQKHPTGYETIREYMERDYPPAKDFDSFVYLSQLTAAQGVMSGLLAHRQAMPYSMGTLYWQLNDCWPVVSWSSIDWYGQWKALHYFVRDAYSPLLLTIDLKGQELFFYLVSDLQVAQKGLLELSLLDFQGQALWQYKKKVAAQSGASTPVLTIPLAQMLADRLPSQLMLLAEFKQGEKVLGKRIHYFCPPKELILPKPQLQTECRMEGERILLTLRSNTLVKNLCLSCQGQPGWWSDNFFDLLPSIPVTVEFIPSDHGGLSRLPDIDMMSVYDCRQDL